MRLALADCPDHVGRDHRRYQAETHLGQRESRTAGGDHDVAGRDQPDRAAISGAVHDGDGRLGLRLEPGEEGREAARIGFVGFLCRRARRAHLADVGAGAEDVAGTFQHDDAYRHFARERRERLGEPGDELGGERVAPLRPVERQRGDAARVAVDA